MDQGPLVEMQINDGAKVVEELRAKGFDVQAAWWMKASDEGLWFLYVASREVDDLGATAAYRKLFSLMRPLGQLWVEPMEVKLVGPGNRIAQDVMAILSQCGGRIPTRYGGIRLGNVWADGAYLYPLSVAA